MTGVQLEDEDLFLQLAQAAEQEGAKAPAAALEEGDDIFLQLAEAAEADDDDGGATAGGSGGGGSHSQLSGGNTAKSSGGGPRLSWAATAAAAGAAGAVQPGHKARKVVLLAPGSIPCSTAPPPSVLLPPAAVGLPSRGVATFGAAFGAASAPSGSAAGAAGKGGFADVGQGSLVERYAGLKIKNPRVSHTQLRSRLADAAVLRLSHVKQRHRTAGLEGSWVTICVVGEKSKPRETASGRPFSIWKVTDLDQTCLSLFLFSGAHADLWKEPEGTIVALLGPKVKEGGDFSLSVDSGDQVWVLGQSPEFGYCKATKKNGEPCRMPVNTTRCPFCPYHVQSEYNRMKPTNRTEFQTSNLKTAFRPGMQRGLQWAPGTFETAAAKQQRLKSFGAEQLEGLAANARDRGSAAGARYLTTVANPTAVAAAEMAAQRRLTPAAAIAAAAKLGPAAAALAAAPIPAGRSGGALVLHLPQHSKGQQQKRKSAGGNGGSGGGASKRRAGGGGGSGGMVELEDDDDDLAMLTGGSGDVATAGSGGAAYDPTVAARQRAIELLRAAGSAKAPDPNDTRPRPRSSCAPAADPASRTTLQQVQQPPRPPLVGSVVAGGAGAARPPLAAGRPSAAAPGSSRPAAAPAAGGSSRTGAGTADRAAAGKAGTAAAAGPKSAMEAAFAGVLEDGSATAAAAKGTRYKDLVDDEEQERLDKVMAALEAKDEMAAKMDSVSKLSVQAFRCKACGYTAERRRPECAAHPYAVERVEATKRWWQCDGCKYRFTTVGQKYPAKRCVKCNEAGTSFTAVSMLRPTKEADFQRQQASHASRANMLARGNEQKWCNSW